MKIGAYHLNVKFIDEFFSQIFHVTSHHTDGSLAILDFIKKSRKIKLFSKVIHLSRPNTHCIFSKPFAFSDQVLSSYNRDFSC